MPGKRAGEGPTAWALATDIGHPDGVPGSGIHPGPALVVAETTEPEDEKSLSLRPSTYNKILLKTKETSDRRTIKSILI